MAKNQAPVGRQVIVMAVSSNSFPAPPSLNSQRVQKNSDSSPTKHLQKAAFYNQTRFLRSFVPA